MDTTKVRAMDCLHFINGQFVSSQSGRIFQNINPAMEEVIGTVAEGGNQEVEYAVAAAQRALSGSWSKKTLQERSYILRRIGDLILARKDELALLESLDTGNRFP